MIQYDSSMQLLNSSVMEIRKQKDEFDKNSYKFQQVSSGKVGFEKDGFLHIRKVDLNRIHERSDRPQFERQRRGNPAGKKFKMRKGGKGKVKGKGKRK